jgi:hypothetical protein
MSTVKLCHSPYNKTIIDTQVMWTDLTTLRNLTLLADHLGHGEKLTFYPLYLTILNSFINLTLRFKIIALTIRQTLMLDLTQEAGSVPQPQTSIQGRQDPSTRNQKDFSQFTIDAGLFNVSIKCHVCFTINKETGTIFRCP